MEKSLIAGIRHASIIIPAVILPSSGLRLKIYLHKKSAAFTNSSLMK